MLPYGTALIFELHKAVVDSAPESNSDSASASGVQTLELNSSSIYDPQNLIVKTFLMEGIDKKSAVVRQRIIPGCGDGDGDGDCTLAELKDKFENIAVWSRDELMQIC